MPTEDLTTGSDTTHLTIAGDESGDAVLFLHGTGPGATGFRSFEPLLPWLASYRCVVPDLVGFGRSSHPDDVPPGPGPWFARRVDAVLSLIDVLGLRRVHVVGHSYGARVALGMVRRVPDRVGRVVLLAAGGTPVKAALSTLTGFYDDPGEPAMRRLVAAQLSRGAASDMGDYVRERLGVAIRADVRRSFRAAMAPGDPMPTYDGSVLATVEHRVLAVHGKDDRTISPDASLFLAEHVPRSDLHLFAGCGHLLQYEVPGRLGALIRGFLVDEAG